MALVLKDRVKETTTTTGTGTVTLDGASSGFQSFSVIGNGNSTYYVIADPVTGDWEVGIGTYTSSGTTLSRTTVLSSSNAGSLVSFVVGVKDVFVSYPSSRAVYQNEAGNATVQGDFGTINATTANLTTAALTNGTVSATPVNNTDIVNKQYADAIASGIHFHEAVAYATAAALPANTYNNGTGGVGATLTANANGALTVDGYTFTSPADDGTRILVKNEVTGANNGVYTLTQAGNASPGAPYILTRATDFDSAGAGVDQIDEGDFFLVTGGAVNANTAWVQQTPPPITVGTTALVFQQFSAPITYTAGTGLSESPTYTFNIADIGTAGTYGSASQVPVFITNAQGQVTSVVNTNIAINGSAVTGNIAGSAGSVANALTFGTYLTGTSYDGSAPVTATVDATSANTASKVVARDGSGNFSAGTITAALSGNATTATTATNIAGGTANQIAYQTATNTTGFTAAPTASGELLSWNGSAYAWVSPVPVASGGTGATTLTANNVLLGNGTSALQVVAPGPSGNLLTSNGTTWVSSNDATVYVGKLGVDSQALTTAVSGIFEYDGLVPYFTPQGTQRGALPAEQYYRLNSTFVGSNATGGQPLFGVGVTVSASTTYQFEALVLLTKTAGSSSHTVATLFGGTATVNNIGYNLVYAFASAGSTTPSSAAGTNFFTVATASVFTNAIVGGSFTVWFQMRGTVSINAGGTFIPQYQLSAAPGGAYTTRIGSFFRLSPIGAAGANVSVGTWA